MCSDRVLVVDDDDNWLKTIARVLASQCEVELALDAARSLQLVRTMPFALAVLDQRLGEILGIDLLDQLRAIQPDLPAIILTGHADVEDADHSIVRGVTGYLSKGNPRWTAILRERVTSVLAERNSIASLISKGENDMLEFKSSARWDMNLRRVNKDIESVIVKTVAGLLNSYKGGDLLIGVGDDGQPVGLEHDYESLGRHKDRDGFHAFLVKLLTDAYGKDVSAFININFYRLGANDVCRVAVRPAAHEIYVEDEKFFLRIGNTTARLSTREANEYCRLRWPHAPPQRNDA